MTVAHFSFLTFRLCDVYFHTNTTYQTAQTFPSRIVIFAFSSLAIKLEVTKT